ncbi:MAG: BlaI/MecI/CopY family transcriptional regulator [Lachnospiraceae bacterium]|nr:BlaI/MecI/CopY family transcriptional regulator [Lachnospiraceae bacterium]
MKLTERELEVMRILWEADKPLMVSEIVQRDKNGTIYSVQRIIQNLIKKEMVAVEGMAYNKKALGRTFKPLVSAESIEQSHIQDVFSKMVSRNIAVSHLIAALLPADSSEQTLEELNRLEDIIRERKKRILGEETSGDLQEKG